MLRIAVVLSYYAGTATFAAVQLLALKFTMCHCCVMKYKKNFVLLIFNQSIAKFTAMQWLLSPEPVQKEYLVPLVEDLLVDEHCILDSRMTWLQNSMRVAKKQALEVAHATSGQRNDPMRSAIRKLRFTASKFGELLLAVDKGRLV